MVKNILKLFGGSKSKQMPNDSNLRLQSSNYRPVRSTPEGLFTFYVSDKALSAMKELADISLDEMAPLTSRVFSKCHELGFLRDDPLASICHI